MYENSIAPDGPADVGAASIRIPGSKRQSAKSGRGTKQTSAKRAPRRSYPELFGARILIVEDDDISAKLVSVLLKVEGAVIKRTRSAEEALPIAAAFSPQIAVLDLILPAMSGLLLAEHLKARAATSDIVLVAMSSYDGRETESIALGAGCAAFVKKPIDAAELLDVVAAHLAQSKKGRRL